MSKRILIFSLVYYPRFIGGAEVAIKEITDRLGDDFEFDMITLRKHAPAFERIGKINVYRVGFPWRQGTRASSKIFPLSKLLFPFMAAFAAWRLQRKRPYDALWGMMAAYAGFAALFFKLLHPKIPFVLTLQEGDPIPYIKRRVAIVYPLFRMIFTKADIIQSISQYLGSFGRSMGFTGTLEVIPNGVDVAHFSRVFPESSVNEMRERLGKKMGDVFLITTSRLVRKNAVDDVIRALSLLPSNVHFAILGTGPDERELKRLAQTLTLSSRVHFFGYVAHEEMPKYLNASDIFIRPSRSEGMGNSFVEAMASGLPVIATQEGGIADFLFDEKRNPDKPVTGWAVDTDSPEQIAEAVKNIMAHPEKMRAVTATARAMVAEKYDWNLIARDMQEKVFRPALAE